MSGPLSTNAPFTTLGQTMILRDIEQLYLLIGDRNGDLGNAGYKDPGAVADAGAATTLTSLGAFFSMLRAAEVILPSGANTYFSSFSTILNGIGISATSSNITVPPGQYIIDVFSNGVSAKLSGYTMPIGWTVGLYVNGTTSPTYEVSRSRLNFPASASGDVELTTTATISTVRTLISSDVIQILVINTGGEQVVCSCTVKLTKVM